MQIDGLRTILVGGASGFARATAERIAAGGGKVAILDRESSDGAAVAEGLGGTWHPTDVLDFEGIEVVIGEAVEALGGLDVAVNTAGGGAAGRTLSRSGPFDLDAFRSVIDLNLVGTFNTNRLCAAHMSDNEPNEDDERGVLINTASIAAFEGQIGQVAYTAAKAGIAGMTLTMARDLGSLGIRVNTIAPSLFATGLTAGVSDEMAANLVKDSAFPKRLGRPDEYARLAIAMIENPMLNGDTIRLDAGTRFAPR
ncbi:SDR family NAD(P)-dependent oxidoreductase [Ilumatobacter sp.]|uniref:SDR family NAD(P)-dependent oxidoreductase n=1 Tax=Ilumatobacter sp. TaxID=1967498 RepID=UPI003B516125